MCTRTLRLLLLSSLTHSIQAQLDFPPLTATLGSAPTTTAANTITVPTDGSTLAATDSLGYPIPTVPPTNLAPFMQKSTLPENFVFILVGGILGSFFASLFIYRAVMSWKIKRTAKRANRPYYAITKRSVSSKAQEFAYGLGARRGSIPAKHIPLYSQTVDSSISLEPMKTGTATPTNRSQLFFSPTADVGARAAGVSPSTRSSAYLPAGYYGPGMSKLSTSSTPSSAPLSIPRGRPTSTIDISNRPRAQSAHSRHFSLPRTPDTDSLTTMNTTFNANMSAKITDNGNTAGIGLSADSPLLRGSVDIGPDAALARMKAATATRDGKAPSRFLEEMFGDDADDSTLPPPRSKGNRRGRSHGR